MKIRYLAFIFLFFLSCDNSQFKTHKSGLKYKFIVENKKQKKAKLGDVLAIVFKTLTEKNRETIEQSGLFRIQLQKPMYKGGAVEDALAMMHKGDSALFLIDAKKYYTKTRQMPVPEQLVDDNNVCLAIKVVDIISKEEYEKEQKAAQIVAERLEDKQLETYLQQNKITQQPTLSGLYIIEKKKGVGKLPVPGKKVTVHYSGYFIDGKMFDSSVKRNEPFTFTLGVGEVIAGWDEGVATMKEGAEVQLIIPSSLAYGSKQTGPIPPYSTLVFDVKMIKAE